jgi:hypothetical protein
MTVNESNMFVAEPDKFDRMLSTTQKMIDFVFISISAVIFLAMLACAIFIVVMLANGYRW